ncbi:DNA-binding transcriptional LysR family regulator [Vibrio sp. ES.051]|uniref:LysR family transcriptional regulator n=1 Tax=Vibrio sp. ES.051 TaxID=1761909 RepID=UPI000BF9F3DB|nr:LysR family transcriptional regulator [Vibrio sp. ES.051]PFG56264.1 DNA-binding transcriptional LysR family regulator [Vibrio sp. ES.051]
MKLIHPQLLLTYIAVCETGSFTRAADRIHNSQSTISQQINRLESIIGDNLLIRTSQKVKLTEKGEFVLRYAHRIIELNNSMLDSLNATSEQTIIKIGVPDDLSVDVTRAIMSFQRTDNVLFEFTSGLSNDLYQSFLTGKYDIVLAKQPMLGNAFAYRHEPLVWLDSASAPTFHNPIVPLVLFPTGALYRDHILSSLDSLGYSHRVNYCSSNLSAIMTASAVGFGVTLLPQTCKTHEHVVVDELQALAPADDLYLGLYISDMHSPVLNKIAITLVRLFELEYVHSGKFHI